MTDEHLPTLGLHLKGASPLTLKYVFTPDPNPIRASVGGANPNTIDLQVMISNPTLNPVQMQSITIEIPVGEDSARSLSTSPNLPAPVPATSGDWTISTSGDTITLQTGDSSPGTITDNIIFTLEGVQVNDTAGVVPVTITEMSPSAPKVRDDSTYSVVKQEADFPITNFYATPATLYDLDQTVTLYWKCSSEGQDYVYSVHSDSWQPKDCVNTGNCYTCQDGTSGVQTPPLSQSTLFALDVIKSGSIYKTLYTNVEVVTPSVDQNSFLEQSSVGSGRLVRLHWIAYNASRCTVLLEGQVVTDNAPTDTYLKGYTVPITGAAGAYQLALVAHAISGDAQASFTFPDVKISDPLTVAVGAGPCGVAVTPDNSLAFVVNGDGNNVTVIDLGNCQAEPNTIGAGNSPVAATVTPDGKLALVANTHSQDISVIDIAARKTEPATISVGTEPNSVSVTPDGTLALVTETDAYTVTFINIASRSALNSVSVGETPWQNAITPDGKLCLVTNGLDGTVSVINIANGAVVATIPVGREPMGIAITPDGKLALVGNLNDQTITFIDLATLQAEPNTVGLASMLYSMAITPDGAFAMAPMYNGTVAVIDIAGRTLLSGGIAVGQMPMSIAIAPDGKLAIVTNRSNNNVTII